MSVAEWYLVALTLGAGLMIVAYWLAATAFTALPLPSLARAQIEAHVVAEFVTAAALIAAGASRLVASGAWVDPLTGVALGMLIYALVGSSPMYERDPIVLGVFAAGVLATIPGLVLLLI